MKKWNLIIDVAKCFNCNMCALACHDEYYDNEHPKVAASMPRQGHRWIDILQKERGQYPMVDVVYLPVTCNHCDDAPCLKAARNGAVTKRTDGIVLIDPVAAKGQRQLVESCPYKAIWWNEESQLPQIWPFDAHLLDQGWRKTRGAQVCPTQAMLAVCVEDSDMARLAATEKLEVLKPELGLKPRVYYKNLDRWTKAFIGGQVTGEILGVVECVAGAKIVLSHKSERIGETVSDTFGDFRFDALPEESGAYRIEIEAQKFPAKQFDITLGKSAYLGEMNLGRAQG